MFTTAGINALIYLDPLMRASMSSEALCQLDHATKWEIRNKSESVTLTGAKIEKCVQVVYSVFKICIQVLPVNMLNSAWPWVHWTCCRFFLICPICRGRRLCNNGYLHWAAILGARHVDFRFWLLGMLLQWERRRRLPGCLQAKQRGKFCTIVNEMMVIKSDRDK